MRAEPLCYGGSRNPRSGFAGSYIMFITATCQKHTHDYVELSFTTWHAILIEPETEISALTQSHSSFASTFAAENHVISSIPLPLIWPFGFEYLQPGGVELVRRIHEALYGKDALAETSCGLTVRDEYVAWAISRRKPLE